MYVALPKSTEAQVLGKQVLRSGTSVGANYREAFRGRSRAEFIAEMGDCLKEIEETDYWIDLIIAEEIVAESKMTQLKQETSELIAIFVSAIKSTRSNS